MAKAESIEKGKSRFYPCPKCGDTHPSITTILDVISSKALIGWMAKNGTAKLEHYITFLADKFPEAPAAINTLAETAWVAKNQTPFFKSGKQIGSEAADYGTLAHGWIESHLHGKDVSLETLPLPAQNSVNEMLKWEKEHKLETIKTEETFYNCKLNYAGTADWVGKLDGELSIGDWKTSSGIYLNYVIQGWGYALADETQNAERLYREIFIGRFGKDGSSEVKIFHRNEFPSIETARDVLIACGHIFQALQQWDIAFPYKRKPKIKGEPPCTSPTETLSSSPLANSSELKTDSPASFAS